MKAFGAVIAQGIQAAVSFALQILVARLLGIDELGRFAILYGVLVLATAVVTGLVGDSLVVLDRTDPRVRGGLLLTLVTVVFGLSVVAILVAALSGFADPVTALLFGAAVAAFTVEEIVRRLLMAHMRFIRVALIDFLGFEVAIIVILLSSASLSLGVFLGAIAAGQIVAAVTGLFLLPASERVACRLRGADVRSVWGYGTWRAMQQMLRPGQFTLVRLLVLGAAGATAVGLLEAARTYTSPVLLVVGGLSSFLFVRFAQNRAVHTPAVRLRQADRAVVTLLILSMVLGAVALLLAPLFGPLLFAAPLDPIAVICWIVYGASVALVTPYGALAAVSSRQSMAFMIRAADTVVGLIAVMVLLAIGMPAAWAPLVLAGGSVMGGIALRVLAQRTTTSGDGGESEPDEKFE